MKAEELEQVKIGLKGLPGRLREARTRNGWLAADVARWAMISPEQLSRAESGRQMPTVATLARLAVALRVSLDWLVGLVEGP